MTQMLALSEKVLKAAITKILQKAITLICWELGPQLVGLLGSGRTFRGGAYWKDVRLLVTGGMPLKGILRPYTSTLFSLPSCHEMNGFGLLCTPWHEVCFTTGLKYGPLDQEWKLLKFWDNINISSWKVNYLIFCHGDRKLTNTIDLFFSENSVGNNTFYLIYELTIILMPKYEGEYKQDQAKSKL
jgi:hypothetical protein